MEAFISVVGPNYVFIIISRLFRVLPPRTQLTYISFNIAQIIKANHEMPFFCFSSHCLNHTCMFRVIYWKMISFMLYRGQNREAEIKLIFLSLSFFVVCMSGSEWSHCICNVSKEKVQYQKFIIINQKRTFFLYQNSHFIWLISLEQTYST